MCRRYPTNVSGLQIICQFFPLIHVSSITFLKIKFDRSVNGIGYIAFIHLQVPAGVTFLIIKLEV